MVIRELDLDSDFGKDALRIAALARDWRCYLPREITERRLIHLPNSFDEYMAGFKAKRRKNLRRAMRRFRGEYSDAIQVVRVIRDDQIPWYVEQLRTLGPKTWQWRNLPHFRKSFDEGYIRWLESVCRGGWLRCYVLLRGRAPVAYVHGYQHLDRYYYDEPGYDEAYESYSVGNLLLLEVIEDLCTFRSPAVFDFGYGENQYKTVFSQGGPTYREAHVYLLRRSVYTDVACSVQKFLKFSVRQLRRGLDRTGLRSRVRHMARRH